MKKTFTSFNNLILLSCLFLLSVTFYGCKKDIKQSDNPFFNYTGNDKLIAQTISQLIALEAKKPFADSLKRLGTFKWDAYFQSHAIKRDSDVNYRLIVPYVNNSNILDGYISISIQKGAIVAKPIVHSYQTTFAGNDNPQKSYIVGTTMAMFQQKGLTLPIGFKEQQALAKTQFDDFYAHQLQQIKQRTKINSSLKTLDAGTYCKATITLDFFVRDINYDSFHVGNNYLFTSINQKFISDLGYAYPYTSFELLPHGVELYGPPEDLALFRTSNVAIQILLSQPNVSGVDWDSYHESDLCNTGQPGDGGTGGNGAPVTFTITNHVKDPCINKMVDSAINRNIAFNVKESMNAIFNSNSNFNLNFKDSLLNDPHIDGLADVISIYNIAPAGSGRIVPGAMDLEITINSNLSGASQEYITATILHEILHAYFRYSSTNFDHDVMVTEYIPWFVSALHSIYPNTSTPDLTALAYGGLMDTGAFMQSDQDAMQNIYQIVNYNYKNGNTGKKCL